MRDLAHIEDAKHEAKVARGRSIVIDPEGFRLATITDGALAKALARREVTRTPNPDVYRLREDAIARAEENRTPLTPAQLRRRHLQKAGNRR